MPATDNPAHSIYTASDAALNNPATGDTLQYNASLMKWSNAALTTQSISNATAVGKAVMGASSASAARTAIGALAFVNAADYGWSESNAAAANDTAFAAAITAARAAQLPLFLGAGTFQVSATLDLRATSSRAQADTVLGAGKAMTTIVFPDAVDMLYYGGYSGRLADFTLTHASKTPSASMGDGIVFYKAAYCNFERIYVDTAKTGIGLYQGDVSPDPGGSAGAGNWMFSCTFNDMSVNRYYASALNLQSYSGRSTGSVWNNTYLQNQNYSGGQLTSTGPAVNLYLLDESVFNQLNIEDLEGASVGILHNAGGTVVFNSLHFERVHLGGTWGSQLIRVYGNSAAIVNGISYGFSDVARPSAGGTSTVVSVGGAGRAHVTGFNLNYLTKTGSIDFTLGEITDTTAGNSLEIIPVGPNIGGTSVLTTITKSTTANGLKRAGDILYGLSLPSALAAPKAASFYANASTAASAFAITQVATSVTNFNDDSSLFALSGGSVTVSTAGLYQISYFAAITPSGSGSLDIMLSVNGSVVSEVSTVAAIQIRLASSTIQRLNAGDTISLSTYNTVAATLNGATAKDVGFSLVKIG